jgi:hypothetical protein
MKIEKYDEFDKPLEMVFGDDDLKFKEFVTDDEDDEEFTQWLTDTFRKNDNKVFLSMGFAEEWSEWVDYDRSYAYIKDDKLYVVVYGIPSHINHGSVKKYYEKDLYNEISDPNSGDFFDVEPGSPISFKIEYKGELKII